MTDESTRPANVVAIEGCLANAGELLRGARVLLNGNPLLRLAYQLATLALEEIGKASILRMQAVSTRHGRELPPFVSGAVLDYVRQHLRKLGGSSQARWSGLGSWHFFRNGVCSKTLNT